MQQSLARKEKQSFSDHTAMAGFPCAVAWTLLSADSAPGAIWTTRHMLLKRHMLLLLLPLALVLSSLSLLNFWTDVVQCAFLLVLTAGALTLPLPLLVLPRTTTVEPPQSSPDSLLKD